MTQKAIVKKLLQNNLAEIEVTRQSACSHDCSKCGGCGGAQVQRIQTQAINRIGAKIGETVTIEGENKEVFRAATVVYLVPLILFFAIFALLRGFSISEGVATASAIAGFILGIVIAIGYNKRVRQRGVIPFVIIARS